MRYLHDAAEHIRGARGSGSVLGQWARAWWLPLFDVLDVALFGFLHWCAGSGTAEQGAIVI